MKARRKRSLLESFARIHMAAEQCNCGDRCLVSPSPELQLKLQKDIEQLRKKNSPVLSRLLKARDKNRVGFNDGLIFPGSYFPVGTPAHRVRSIAGDRAPIRGDVRVIVVLVDFNDEGFAANHDQGYYQDLFFSENVLPNGSVREYYKDVTGGLVKITGEVVGPYRMPRNLSDYAHGESGTGNASPNARDMAQDAAEAANADVDFSLYDNDGNGFVDAFIVLQAGPGAESTGDSDHIWSHKWVLPSVYDADGTKIYGYLVVPEEATIGVCCHELGHLLFGFPDLYDIDYSSSGIGNWCLMSGGSWNGGGEVPAQPSAWCKVNQEWVTVINQTTNSVESIEDVKISRTVYRLWKDGAASDEYFLVENRQQTGYDLHLPAGGLLIWHIDDSISSNADETHYKVALEQADDQQNLENGNNRGDDGDPFPGSTNNTAFNSSSSPSSRSYGNMVTCVAVENISAPGPIMTAQLKVKCPVRKSYSEDKSIFKEYKKEYIKDYFKEIIKERSKEIFKDQKEKEYKEVKELKEFKEYKEKDWKDLEGPRAAYRADKTVTKEAEKLLGEKGPEGGPIGSPYGAGEAAQAVPDRSLQDRLAAVEQQLAGIIPFIHAGLRPDLRRSALAQETDVVEAQRDMLRRGAKARAAKKGTTSGISAEKEKKTKK